MSNARQIDKHNVTSTKVENLLSLKLACKHLDTGNFHFHLTNRIQLQNIYWHYQ